METWWSNPVLGEDAGTIGVVKRYHDRVPFLPL